MRVVVTASEREALLANSLSILLYDTTYRRIKICLVHPPDLYFKMIFLCVRVIGQEQKTLGSQPRARHLDFPLGDCAMAEKTAQADEAVTNYCRATTTP